MTAARCALTVIIVKLVYNAILTDITSKVFTD